MAILNPARVLTRAEVLAILKKLRPLAKDHPRNKKNRRAGHRLNLAIFRLACCCGLRATEISLLRLKDVVLIGPRPIIRVRAETSKGRHAKYDATGNLIRPDGRRDRIVPLWWDQGTLEDLRDWIDFRKENLPDHRGGPCRKDSLVICGVMPKTAGRMLPRHPLAGHWKTAIATALDEERVDQLSIHCGRHTWATLSLDSGRGLIEVMNAGGWRNLQVMLHYLHAVEREGLGDVFAPNPPPRPAMAVGGTAGEPSGASSGQNGNNGHIGPAVASACQPAGLAATSTPIVKVAARSNGKANHKNPWNW